MSYIGYFDLLGVSSLATLDPDSYYSSLEIFRETISQNCSILEKDGKIYFFSDCAFVESSDLLDVISFIRKIRLELFLQGAYFRGAIGPGILEQKDVISKDRYSDEIYKSRKKIVTGFSFGKNIIPIYSNENNLKGIGIWVENVDKNTIGKECVVSCHIPQMNNRRAICYNDLKFDVSDITSSAVESLLQNFYKANAQNSKLGRYYIPLLITWVQSLNLSTIEFDKNWEHENTPDIIHLLFSGKMQHFFKDVVGLEYVYFAALNKIYEDCKLAPDVIEAANEFFFKRKYLQKYYGTIPNELFFPHNKKDYLLKLSENRINL